MLVLLGHPAGSSLLHQACRHPSSLCTALHPTPPQELKSQSQVIANLRTELEAASEAAARSAAAAAAAAGQPATGPIKAKAVGTTSKLRLGQDLLPKPQPKLVGGGSKGGRGE